MGKAQPMEVIWPTIANVGYDLRRFFLVLRPAVVFDASKPGARRGDSRYHGTLHWAADI